MAKIKGFGIRGLLRYVKVSGFSGGISEILKGLPASEQETFKNPIMASAWYPYTAFGELIRAIDRRIGRGDLTLCRQIGMQSADQDLHSVFKIVLSLAQPQTIAARGDLLWGRYCDAGKMKTVEAGKGVFRVQVLDFPQIYKEHCVLIEGWTERAGDLGGAKQLKVREDKCVHRRDPYCEFSGIWTV